MAIVMKMWILNMPDNWHFLEEANKSFETWYDLNYAHQYPPAKIVKLSVLFASG